MADEHINPDDIKQLLNPGAGGDAARDTQPPGGDPSGALDQDEIEALIQGATARASQGGKVQAAGEGDDRRLLAQNDIEQLLEPTQAGMQQPAAKAPSPLVPPQLDPEGIATGDIEFLLDQAEQALASVDHPRQDAPPGMSPFQFQEFRGGAAPAPPAAFDLIRDVELDLKIELGRTQMYLEDVLKLRKGAVVPLDKLAGDPVDIYVNGRLIARGEVLVLNDNFCVRVNELLAAQENAAG